MTRKHFKQLADIVGEIQGVILTDEYLSTNGLSNMVEYKIAQFCKNQNSRFDWGRFSDAIHDKREEIIEQLNNLNTD